MVLILPPIQNAFSNVVQHDIIKPTADIRVSEGAVRRGRMGGGREGGRGREGEKEGGQGK